MKDKILVVDDEKGIVDVLAYALKKEGYDIDKAYDGNEALEKIKSFNPMIVILDLMLPGIDGFEICKKLEDENIGIIMLTAKNDIIDKVLGLEFGADDYLTKPFEIREVIARVKSLSRRIKKIHKNNDIIVIDGLVVDQKQHMVKVDGHEIDLTPKEFELISLLLGTMRVFSREQLLSHVWDMDYYGGIRTVDTHIQRIRKKLGEKYQDVIATVHGVGYKGVNKLV